jgi:hypothetical protein
VDMTIRPSVGTRPRPCEVPAPIGAGVGANGSFDKRSVPSVKVQNVLHLIAFASHHFPSPEDRASGLDC